MLRQNAWTRFSGIAAPCLKAARSTPPQPFAQGHLQSATGPDPADRSDSPSGPRHDRSTGRTLALFLPPADRSLPILNLLRVPALLATDRLRPSRISTPNW